MARARGGVVGFTEDCKLRVRLANAFLPIIVTVSIRGAADWTEDAAEWLAETFPAATDVWFTVVGSRRNLSADVYLGESSDDTIAAAAIEAGKAVAS